MQALWQLLSADPRFQTTYKLEDVLYRLMLDDGIPPRPESDSLRQLDAGDFPQWERLNRAYFAELSLPLQASLEQRRSDFLMRVRAGLWWGAFDDRQELASIASLNATYGSIGQVGGVYTRPAGRRKGLSRAVLQLLMADCRQRLRFDRLVLFTGEANLSARRLYESLGFHAAGVFGLMVGVRRLNLPAPHGGSISSRCGRTRRADLGN